MAKLSSFQYQDTSTCYLFTIEGEPVLDDQGTQLYVVVHGKKSSAYENKVNEQQNRRIKKAGKASAGMQMTAEQLRKEAFELVVACVADWHIEDESGDVVPCTEDNVRRIFTEYPGIYEVVDAHIHDEANFLTSASAS
jgi:hypothetical protein